MARVVWTWCNLIDEEGVIFEEKHLDSEDTLTPEAVHGFPCEFLRFAVDGSGDAAGWSVDELADAVLVDCLYSGKR